MKSVIEKKEGNKVSFNIEIKWDEFEKGLQKSYLQNRGRFNIPGFRKGKTPRKIIEMNYGVEVFYDDAINFVLPEKYETAIEELELEPVDRPEVDIETIEKGEPIEVKISVDVKPEVELGDYKNIELEKIDYSVTDEMVNTEINGMRDSNARLVDANDREIKEGDQVTIDFVGRKDGEAFEGGTARDTKLEIGSQNFIPGFEEGLVGHKKDEVVDVDVTFPEEYQEESLAGQDAKFEVTINDIKEKQLPELDDEFAKDVSEFDTLDELKEDIKGKIEEELKNQEKVETENRVLEKLIETSQVDIPEGMIESQLDDEVKQFDVRLKNQGLELEKYLELTGSDMKALREQLRPTAEKRVNADLILEALVEEENIEVNEEEVDKELVRIAEQYNTEDTEEFIADMKRGDLGFLKQGIANNKAIDLLLKNIKYN
ncbi:MAG: trigger factor [Tissierella sp.]|uniref:trigger factor n=1 Tax=Tissierella sp. TaxID=41274 RepID=UPI003F9DCF9F